jgi:flagellin
MLSQGVIKIGVTSPYTGGKKMSNMVIRTNVLSLNSHRNLGLTGVAQARSSARLSSGFRINSAADDAAGLGISEKMRSQIRGLDQASRNAQDGISLIQTAEGALSTVNEMIIRIRELVIQAANDTNVHDPQNVAQSDRLRIQDEINQLIEEIDATAMRTEFNTRTLLDGGLGASNMAFNISGMLAAADSMTALTANSAAWALGGNLTNITLRPNIGGVNTADRVGIALNSALRSLVLSVTPGRSTAAGDLLAGTAATATSSQVQIADFRAFMHSFSSELTSGVHPDGGAYGAELATGVPADFAALLAFNPTAAVPATMSQSAFDSIVAARAALISTINNVDLSSYFMNQDNLWFQIGANLNQGINVNLNAVNAERLGLGFRDASGSAISYINVTHASGEVLQSQVTLLDNALAMATAERSRMGAIQNRLEFTIQNLDVASENLQAANSRIRDADMAREMMNLTQMNVLQQAATAMLAQANQAPQMVLQLLG